MSRVVAAVLDTATRLPARTAIAERDWFGLMISLGLGAAVSGTVLAIVKVFTL